MHVQSKSQSQTWDKSVNTFIVAAQKFFVNLHSVDALLGKLESSEENGVDHARTRHGHTKA
jgi:hypothetical protein